jgi:hypothetical protein
MPLRKELLMKVERGPVSQGRPICCPKCGFAGPGLEAPTVAALPVPVENRAGWIQQWGGAAIPEATVWTALCHSTHPLRNTGIKQVNRLNLKRVANGETYLQSTGYYREYPAEEFDAAHRLWLSKSDK